MVSRVIFLNGTSSSGKSSIATELLRLLDEPYFHMSVDDFNAMRSTQRTLDLSEDGLADVLHNTRAGFHRAAAGMARAGNNVIVDHVLSEPWRLADCLAVFQGLDVLFVGVRCSTTKLRRRELVRGDRPLGLAESQLACVHVYGVYDVEVTSDESSAAECA
jgi:chloramphenicol 3-O phosphotransferase